MWAARGMIRSRSGTIALCVAGKRRKIIDHGPVNMNGRSGSNRPGATLLRRICKKGTGHRGPHATQAFPISPDSLCSGFSEAAEQRDLLLILLREFRKKNGIENRNLFHVKLNVIHNSCNNTNSTKIQQNKIILFDSRFERSNL